DDAGEDHHGDLPITSTDFSDHEVADPHAEANPEHQFEGATQALAAADPQGDDARHRREERVVVAENLDRDEVRQRGGERTLKSKDHGDLHARYALLRRNV